MGCYWVASHWREGESDTDIHQKLAPFGFPSAARRERDRDFRESQQRLREGVGEEGYAFIQSIAVGMRADEAGRLLNLIQDNMGANRLNPEQGDRLKKLVQAEIARLKMDIADLFRPPDEWAQLFGEHQEHVLAQAAALMTPARMEALRPLAALDLAQKKEEMIFKRKLFGMKQPLLPSVQRALSVA